MADVRREAPNKEFLGTDNLRGKPAEYFAGSILI
jgi:hypothetical protein